MIVACIPVYNEERDLGPIIIKTSKFVDKIIICDDGSTDLSSEIAKRLGCVVINHKSRLGKGVALKDLFKKALDFKADIIVTLDGDGQHYPKDIPTLVKPIIDNEFDMVVGSRFITRSKDVPQHRLIGNSVLTSFTRLLSSDNFKDLTDSQSGFRAYSKKVLENIKILEDGMGVDSEILISASNGFFKVTEIPISVSYVDRDGSTFNPIHHTLSVFNSLIKIASEQKPLLYFGLPGVITIFGGIIVGLRVLDIFLDTKAIATGSALISVGLIVIGFLATTTAVILQVILKNKKK